MNTEADQHGTSIQRILWVIQDGPHHDLYQQLKPCRFSFLVALIACPVFLRVAQGTEILRVLGEGLVVSGQWYLARVFGFFAALILWALSSWYTARVLLYLDFPGVRRRSKLAEKHVPRILGIAPFLIVGCGFLVASSSYDRTAPAKFWLHFFAGLCAVLAIAFYILLIVRRKWIGPAPQEQVKRMTQLGGTTILAVSIIFVISLPLFFVFATGPRPGRAKAWHGQCPFFGRHVVDQSWQFVDLLRSSLAVANHHHVYRKCLHLQLMER